MNTQHQSISEVPQGTSPSQQESVLSPAVISACIQLEGKSLSAMQAIDNSHWKPYLAQLNDRYAIVCDDRGIPVRIQFSSKGLEFFPFSTGQKSLSSAVNYNTAVFCSDTARRIFEAGSVTEHLQNLVIDLLQALRIVRRIENPQIVNYLENLQAQIAMLLKQQI